MSAPPRNNIYTALAAKFFNRRQSKVTADQEEFAKRWLYLSLFGCGDDKMAKLLYRPRKS